MLGLYYWLLIRRFSDQLQQSAIAHRMGYIVSIHRFHCTGKSDESISGAPSDCRNDLSAFRKTRKALTRGRTDHFAAGVTYLHFTVQVRFSAASLKLVSPIPLSLSAKKEHFCAERRTLTYDLYHQNWHRWGQDETPCQICVNSAFVKLSSGHRKTDRHTHTHAYLTDCFSWTTK